ncbi:MAG: ABC transporter substrate-binding protein [Gammaproteobacteria bacterium]
MICSALLAGCASPWNNPYPATGQDRAILYQAFSERPKHLDPVRAYSSNEYSFISQIYEPPLQYHYLKRPYELVPLTAADLPQLSHFDVQGKPLPSSAPAAEVAYSVYRVQIQPGIRYQPHPAFARGPDAEYRYHQLDAPALEPVHALSDFRHTGTRELLAADYVYQIKRLAHPRLHSPIAGLMGQYIVGLDELANTLAKEKETKKAILDLFDYPLSGARVIGRYTYEITIKGKYPQFIYWLAMPFFSPMAWEVERFYAQPGLQERNVVLDWYPVGTGPFMLSENNPNRRMVLERNPNFRGEAYPFEGEPGDATANLLKDAGKSMPFIDEAVFSLEKESIPYWNKFLQGYYDSSSIASDSFDQAIRFDLSGEAQLTEPMRAKRIQLLTAVTASTFYTGFNMLDDVVGGYSERARKLRQAISIAVDFEEYISIFQNGRGIAAQGPLPPGIFGHKEEEAGINPYVYDWKRGRPERKPIGVARRLMGEAGYPDGRSARSGEPLVLYFDTPAAGPDGKSNLDWMRKQLAKLGVQLVVRATDYNRFQEKMREGTAQIFQWGWNADYPDPENFLFLLYGRHGKVNYQGENAANYANPEFDRLFEQVKNMDNGPTRQSLIDRMVDIARRDAPWLWGLHPVGFSLHHAWFGNVKPNLMANNTLKYQRIDAVARAQKRAKWNEPVLWPVASLGIVLVLAIVPALVSYRRREKAAAL